MKTFEYDDPMALVGVRLDEQPDEQAAVEMAIAIVEEYARLGMRSEDIERLFRSPRFRLAHRILKTKGEAFVRDLIAQVASVRAAAWERVP